MTHRLIDHASGQPLRFVCRAAALKNAPRIIAQPAGGNPPAEFASPEAAQACARYFMPHQKTYTTASATP